MNLILIATDGSSGAWAAVKEGLALAFEVGAQVTFVTVRQDASLLGDPWYQRRLTLQLAEARDTLERAEAEAQRLGVHCDSEILEGDPAACIAEAARCRKADLVVVGSRGHGALASHWWKRLQGSDDALAGAGDDRPRACARQDRCLTRRRCRPNSAQ